MAMSLERQGRVLLLAYDHGLEHGPSDFQVRGKDPEQVISIAEDSFTGLILQKGVAKHYQGTIDTSKTSLVVKLNGKTSLSPGEPYAPQICSVKRALDLGASAVGYTLYPGSTGDPAMIETCSMIEEKARDYGIPLIIWSYPRGQGVDRETSLNTVQYAARIALELGADYAKVKYTGSKKSFKRVVDMAPSLKLLCAGGEKVKKSEFIEEAKSVMEAGASGLAVGRNIWMRDNARKVAKELESIVFPD